MTSQPSAVAQETFLLSIPLPNIRIKYCTPVDMDPTKAHTDSSLRFQDYLELAVPQNQFPIKRLFFHPIRFTFSLFSILVTGFC